MPLRKQFGDLIRGQGEEGTALPDHGIRQFFFVFLQTKNFFFDSIFDDQFIDLHTVFLPNAVSTVGCLFLGGEVPPGIVMNDYIGTGEIEAGAARFQGNEKNLGASRLKASTRAALFSLEVEPCSV